jgi:hypothetical protein
MVPAYLVSLLTRQVALLQRDGFLKKHPHPWLVWEAGNWDPPRSPAESDAGATRLPDPKRPERPGAGDALCFELVAKDKDHLFKVGRSSECEIVLNDMTISREQFHLDSKAGKWVLVPITNAHTQLFGRELEAPIELTRESPLKVGHLTLTFCPAAQFAERLAKATKN